MDDKVDHENILQGNPSVFRNYWLVVKPWHQTEESRIPSCAHLGSTLEAPNVLSHKGDGKANWIHNVMCGKLRVL